MALFYRTSHVTTTAAAVTTAPVAAVIPREAPSSSSPSASRGPLPPPAPPPLPSPAPPPLPPPPLVSAAAVVVCRIWHWLVRFAVVVPAGSRQRWARTGRHSQRHRLLRCKRHRKTLQGRWLQVARLRQSWWCQESSCRWRKESPQEAAAHLELRMMLAREDMKETVQRVRWWCCRYGLCGETLTGQSHKIAANMRSTPRYFACYFAVTWCLASQHSYTQLAETSCCYLGTTGSMPY
jgi:hypothetical protein